MQNNKFESILVELVDIFGNTFHGLFIKGVCFVALFALYTLFCIIMQAVAWWTVLLFILAYFIGKYLKGDGFLDEN